MTSPRYRTSKWHGLDNFECELCPFATLDRGQMVNHVRDRHPTASESGGAAPHPLAALPFASDEALELALELGLTPEHFEHHSPTGKTGYVKDDVRAVAHVLNPEE